MELPLVATETKEILLPTPKLIVFDMDGTLIDEPEFYRVVYSGTLNQVVEETKGPEGLQTLAWCRQNLEGKGELALMALGIPFRLWAEKLIDAPMDTITPRPDVVAAIRSIQSKKILFVNDNLSENIKIKEDLTYVLVVAKKHKVLWDDDDYQNNNDLPFFDSLIEIKDYAVRSL